ncbi:MAG TPA: hypothetical protein VFX22_10300 [Candidatus Kapabacteria bacterium]|nr:hypothetical protein [Candidatus Kapabacteria bacterium]
MNTHPNENIADPIYCPSCAARIESATAPTPGELLRCPVCGTEFKYESSQTPESAIAESDRSNVAVPARRQSTEEILLERLTNEPPQKKPIRWVGFALIFAVVIAVSFGIFRVVSKPDSYASQHSVDSLEMVQKDLFFQHVIDSLQTEIANNPSNIDLHLVLADTDYTAGHFAESRKEFETYLAQKPQDGDSRIDYAYAIAMDNGDTRTALLEMDTALRYQPNNLNVLVNAGIMTAQSVNDSNHTTALAKAKEYFVRAKAVAEKTNPAIAARIDTLIMEIDNTGQRLVK